MTARAIALLALFAVVYTPTLGSYGMLQWDEAEYASLGRSVARGEGFTIGGGVNPLRPPVLPLAIAAAIRIAGRSDDAVVKWPALLFSLFTLAVTCAIVATAYDELTGLLAAALLGLSPPFWTWTPLVMTEIPFMGFFVAAVACLYLGLYRDERYLWVCWIAWGLAFLTRYTAVLFAPIGLLFVLILWLGGDERARRRVWSREMWLAPLAALLLLTPWLVREQVRFGSPLAGAKIASTQLQVFAPGVSMPWYFYLVATPGWLSPIMTVLFVSGIVWAIWRRDRFALHLLAATAVVFMWMSAYRFKEVRTVTSTLPLIAIVAAAGVRHAVLAAPRPRRAATVAAVLLLAVAGAEFRTARAEFRTTITRGYPSFLSAMQYLRGHSEPDAVVATSSLPQVCWYADRNVVDLPAEMPVRQGLPNASWVVLTNFERSQPAYAGALMRRVHAVLPGADAVAFRDPQFETLVVGRELVAEFLPQTFSPSRPQK